MALSKVGSADEIPGASDASAPAPADTAPVVVEARDLGKTFRLPLHRVTSLKERALHPFSRGEYRELHALRDVSFDIHKGEFFGIVGRNGSGKSTLLKILASIYGADRGSIRIAGTVAPFIELGVGFNLELTARENVVLNGVMMGLRPEEAAKRLDAVLEFAELEEFVDLKLKNYSSGMLVRLAFSVMIQAEADIMLIDEVLAVGDAAFQQKCIDVFREMRAGGRTIVLVTHDMATVQSFCHRAMLVHDGEIKFVGDPEEVGRRYFRLNFSGHTNHPHYEGEVIPDVHAGLIDVHLENSAGERIDEVEFGDPIRFSATFEAQEELNQPVFGFHFKNADGVGVFGFNQTLDVSDGRPDCLGRGERVTVRGTIENPLMPGRYFVSCWVSRNRNASDIAFQVVHLLDFVVFGQRPGPGVVNVPAEITTQRESKGES
jgi:ABC-type polysaccharide/polyol phosphate transport system ATPase subunit